MSANLDGLETHRTLCVTQPNALEKVRVDVRGLAELGDLGVAARIWAYLMQAT